MSKSSQRETSRADLVVVTDAVALTNKTQFVRFQKATVAALKFLEGEDILSTRRKVLIGFALISIKASPCMKHGEWMSWLKANVKGKGYAQVNFYMRAASACAETMQLAAPDLLALPSTKINALKLEVRDADGFQGKVATFCGDLTFNELLDKHGIKEIKKLGGARTSGSDETPTAPDAETLFQQARDEIGEVLTRAEMLLVTENRLQFLTRDPDAVRGIVTSLRELADKVDAAAKPILKK